MRSVNSTDWKRYGRTVVKRRTDKHWRRLVFPFGDLVMVHVTVPKSTRHAGGALEAKMIDGDKCTDLKGCPLDVVPKE